MGHWFCLLAACASACATIHDGSYAQPLDASGKTVKSNPTASGLVISGSEIADLASPHFGAVQITFENATGSWVHIRTIALGFGGAAKTASVFVPWGEELASWQRAIAIRNDIHRVNTSTTLAAFAIIGATVEGLSKNQATAAVGGLLAAGTLGTAVGRGLVENANAAQVAPMFPETHLLTLPFSVPPGLFAKRWIVLNTAAGDAAGCINGMMIDFETDTGVKQRVWLQLRGGEVSAWQRERCESDPSQQRITAAPAFM
jgi:hypothetical protein